MRIPTSPSRRKKRISRFGDAEDDRVSILETDSLSLNENDTLVGSDRITAQLAEAAATVALNDRDDNDNCPSYYEEATAPAKRDQSRFACSASIIPTSEGHPTNRTVQYGIADSDNVSIVKGDYLSRQAVEELGSDNFAVLLHKAALEDGQEPSGRTRFYEEAEQARERNKETSDSDDDDDDDTVQHENKDRWGRLGQIRLGLCAPICLALSALFAFFGQEIFDEDDVVAVAALAKTGGGAASAAEIDAMAKLMAVAGAQDAASAVASGKAVAAAAAAGGSGGGASGNASATSSTTAQTAVVVTAVAAATAATASLLVGKDGRSLFCPNIIDPDFLKGAMTIDFLGPKRRLTEDEADVMGSTLVESYNEIFGCESNYSRLLLNCSIPCEINETTTMCCEDFPDPAFGNMMRCSFDCVVHCKGCPANEPLFLIEGTNQTILDASPTGNVRSLQSAPNTSITCSPMCMVTTSVEDVVCGQFFSESDYCVAARSYTVATSAAEGGNESVVAEEIFIAPPTAAPTPGSVASNDDPIVLGTRPPTLAPT